MNTGKRSTTGFYFKNIFIFGDLETCLPLIQAARKNENLKKPWWLTEDSQLALFALFEPSNFGW